MTTATAATADRADARPTRARAIGTLLGFLLISSVVAATGALVAGHAIAGWYAAADKPMWTPSDDVFAPILGLSYALMAFGAWLVWMTPETEERSAALTVYVLQLALGAIWAPAFFGLGGVVGAAGPWAALIVIVLTAIVLLATLFRFWELSRAGALLLVPAFAWVLYAMTLNAAIAVLAL
ncbi:MAG: TspO/MBR family protein [Microcella sp.]